MVEPVSPPTPRGRIELICGCMFAGKTSRLIEVAQSAAADGRRVLVAKHPFDARYGLHALATHDGRSFPALPIAAADELEQRAAAQDVVLIDEAHFYGPGLTAVCERLRRRGLRVVVAGIDHDTWGQPIPPLPALKQVADETQILTTACRRCGAAARFSQRLTPIVDGHLIGGPEAYEPRCDTCFRPADGTPPTYDE